MPYIKQEYRLTLNDLAEDVVKELKRLNEENITEYAGNFNFFISSIMNKLLLGNMSYSIINELIGALECTKLELYRRMAAPYENIKSDTNGDVYRS